MECVKDDLSRKSLSNEMTFRRDKWKKNTMVRRPQMIWNRSIKVPLPVGGMTLISIKLNAMLESQLSSIKYDKGMMYSKMYLADYSSVRK